MICIDNDTAETGVGYKTCFERFIRLNLGYTIKWIGKKSELNPKEKFLLLLEVKTRIPEDLQSALEKLDLRGTCKTFLEFSIL